MGVDARLVVYAPDKKTAEDACAAAFERIAALDSCMSDYRQNSELMQLCAKPANKPITISKELLKVLQVSEQLSKQSKGKFDITVGPLVRLWRAARKSGKMPSREEIEKARKVVGWRLVKLDSNHSTATLKVPGMRLDLGAIGKGFADDEAQAVLKAHGIRSALVEMGGDIVVSDPPPGTDGWVVRVPNAGLNHKAIDMHLSNCAVSTSGDAEQFVVIGGKRFSHVVDPATGYALTNGVEATVIAKAGLISDPLSTALTMLSKRDQQKMLKSHPGTKAWVRLRMNFETED